MKHQLFIILVSLFIITGTFSCKKLVEIDTPQNQLTTDKVFSDTTSAIAAMVNVYALFDRTIDVNCNKYLGLYTDEIIYPNNPADGFYTSLLKTDNGTVLNIWKNNYFAIYSCNAIIEQMQRTQKIPENTAKQITAEAKFLRAYAYFYLVNLYGPVPLLLTTDVAQTSKASRTDTTAVYKQIITDLTGAENGLPQDYNSGDKTRATKWAAKALRARVSLHLQDWTGAETNAAAVIASNRFTPLDSPSKAFLANSTETILQFWTQFGYIADGPVLIPGSGAPQFPLSNSLLNSFETGDLRKSQWTRSVVASGNTFTYAYKYHNRNSANTQPEYLTALRISEQYLIRAEARLQLGKIPDAIADINVIRKRAGLALLAATLDAAQARTAIEREWRSEYFAESGMRFLLLKHTGQLNAVMSVYRPTWSAKAAVLPIPQNEINYDQQLIQNQGY